MNSSPKKDCPHVLKDNLINIEKFRELPFNDLKCQKCDEKKDLWICLICGFSFCSKNHFIEHNKENNEHLLYLNIMNLSIWCYECKIKKDNIDTPKEDKGCYIESERANQYKEIYEEFKLSTTSPKEEKELEIKNKNESELEKNEEFKREKELCSHILNDEISDELNESFNFFNETLKIVHKFMNKTDYICLCLSCMERVTNLEDLNEHYDNSKHRLFLNLINWKIICKECKSEFDILLLDKILKFRILFHLLNEKNMVLPKVQLLSEKEIFEIKYNKLANKFKEKKYSKILFMVGAGISTSAGIPDFRSKTGLFKQLQDKYKLSSPEEFFYKTTFLQKPEYFYEFTKLFDLSKTKPTIAHKYMSFLISKNIVKYVFTQNIDGLEKKAKIPDDKLIFAHGNFYEGHCAKCNKSIDINKINEGIQKGEVYYCPICKGPCKPKVVFYGENLPSRFYDIQEECEDVDLIIIMGTSLKVQPFASIPYMTNPQADIAVFNMEEVGNFYYKKLYCNKIFIKGKTDENIIKFLKDTDMLNEYKEFVKKEYNEDFALEENKDSIEKLSQDISNLNLNK